MRCAVGLVWLVLLAAGCGEDDQRAERVRGTPDPAHAGEVDRNPYALTCGDIARQPELCKGREASFTPGRQAVRAVRQGKYLVQPRPEAWNHP